MEIMTIAILCIIGTVLCKLMDKYNKEHALFIAIGISVVVLAVVIVYMSPIVDMVNEIFGLAGIASLHVEILFKSLGVCYVAQFAVDICRDSGEGLMATQVEFAGKVCLMLIALPLFKTIVETVMKFISL